MHEVNTTDQDFWNHPIWMMISERTSSEQEEFMFTKIGRRALWAGIHRFSLDISHDYDTI
jgi:hypothetical protein